MQKQNKSLRFKVGDKVDYVLAGKVIFSATVTEIQTGNALKPYILTTADGETKYATDRYLKAGFKLRTNPWPRSVFYKGSRFFKAAMTEHNAYYCDYRESDDNGNTLCFDLAGTLLSNNYFATCALLDDLIEGRTTWESRYTRQNKVNILESL